MEPMKHLIRAALVVFLAVAVFFILRSQLIPASWGQYGLYRGENVAEWAGLPMQYADTPQCQACHQSHYQQWSSSKHRGVSCENCHGPALSHIQAGAKVAIDRTRDLCATCHAELVSRPSHFPQVALDSHGGQAPCIACHSAHAPKAVSPPPIPRRVEGASDCLACHGSHALLPLPPSHAGRTADLCRNCHRGSER